MFLLILAVSSFLYVVKKANDTTISKNSQAAVTRKKTKTTGVINCPTDWIPVPDFYSACSNLCVKWDTGTNSDKLLITTANLYTGISPTCKDVIVNAGYKVSPNTQILSPASPTSRILPTTTALPTSPPPSPTPMRIPLNPLFRDRTITPETAIFFSLFGRINFNYLSLLPLNSTQRDILYRIGISNQTNVFNGVVIAQDKAIRQGLAVGCTWCSDSRMVLANPGYIPTTLIDGTSGLYVRPLTLPSGAALLDSASIGARPTVYPGVNYSFFITHSTCADIFSGCGAMGGIKTILDDPRGAAYLLEKGIPHETIVQLQILINQGADANPVEWSKMGALVQAQMNLKANGIKHTVAFGYYGHTDGKFTVLGVIDSDSTAGNIIVRNIDDYPLLKGYAFYFNDPHPMIQALNSQTPRLNVISVSKNSVNALFGEIANQPGQVFKVAGDFTLTARGELTTIEANRVLANINYSLAHLEQSGMVLTLVADNSINMDILRAEVLKNSTIREFLRNGGAIFEIVPDQAGKFSSVAIRRFDGLISSGVRSDFIAMAKLNRLGTLLSDSKLARIAKFYEVARPFIPVISTGFRMLGDYYFIRDIGYFVNENIDGETLVYKYTAKNLNVDVIKSPNYNVIQTAPKEDGSASDYEKIKQESGGANPYLIKNYIQGVKIKQIYLTETYHQLFRAWWEHGPGTKDAYSPWSDIQSGNELFKRLEIEISPNNIQPPIKLYTSLMIKPGLKEDDSGHLYHFFNYQKYNP